MKLSLIILLTFYTTITHAESNEVIHFAEHFTSSAALYTAFYSTMHYGLGVSRTDSFIFSAFSTLLIGFTYKYIEQMNQPSNVNFGKPMLYNTIGVVTPAIILFQFP